MLNEIFPEMLPKYLLKIFQYQFHQDKWFDFLKVNTNDIHTFKSIRNVSKCIRYVEKVELIDFTFQIKMKIKNSIEVNSPS